MARQTTGRERMRAEIAEAARGLGRVGILPEGVVEKITARTMDLSRIEKLKPPSGAEIVAMRERARMSQAVFARAKAPEPWKLGGNMESREAMKQGGTAYRCRAASRSRDLYRRA